MTKTEFTTICEEEGITIRDLPAFPKKTFFDASAKDFRAFCKSVKKVKIDYANK